MYSIILYFVSLIVFYFVVFVSIIFCTYFSPSKKEALCVRGSLPRGAELPAAPHHRPQWYVGTPGGFGGQLPLWTLTLESEYHTSIPAVMVKSLFSRHVPSTPVSSSIVVGNLGIRFVIHSLSLLLICFIP